MPLDQETIQFVENNQQLIEKLIKTLAFTEYGHITIYIHQGKFTNMDICLRDRKKLTQNE